MRLSFDDRAVFRRDPGSSRPFRVSGTTSRGGGGRGAGSWADSDGNRGLILSPSLWGAGDALVGEGQMSNAPGRKGWPAGLCFRDSHTART